jgi:hypothetical protein
MHITEAAKPLLQPVSTCAYLLAITGGMSVAIKAAEHIPKRAAAPKNS